MRHFYWSENEDQWKTVISFDIPPQEILTKDSVTIAVDAVVYYKIQDANASIQNVENASESTRMLAQTTLRYFYSKGNIIFIVRMKNRFYSRLIVYETAS